MTNHRSASDEGEAPNRRGQNDRRTRWPRRTEHLRRHGADNHSQEVHTE